MKYAFDTIVLGSDVSSAFTTAHERALWLGDVKDPDQLALALKDDVFVFNRPARHTAEQVVRWVRGEQTPPRDMAAQVAKAQAAVADPHGAAVVIPLSYGETTRALRERGLRTRPRRPEVARVVGCVQTRQAREKAAQPARRGRRRAA